MTEYRSQHRGGKGLIDIKTTDRNGPVVAIAKVTDADEVMLTTTGGILIRTRGGRHAADRPQHPGRPPDPLDEGDTVSSLAKLPEEELGAAVVPSSSRRRHPRWRRAVRLPPLSPLPHILDDGVAEAEASDHLDDDTSATEMEEN